MAIMVIADELVAQPTKPPAFNGSGWDELCPECRRDISDHVRKMTEPAREQGRAEIRATSEADTQARIKKAVEYEQRQYRYMEQRFHDEILQLKSEIASLKAGTRVLELEAEVKRLHEEIDEAKQAAYEEGYEEGKATALEDTISFDDPDHFKMIGDKLEFAGYHIATFHHEYAPASVVEQARQNFEYALGYRDKGAI